MGGIISPLKELYLWIIQKIKNWNLPQLKKKPPSYEIQLTQEVQRNAHEVLAELKAIKEDLRHSIDGKLFTYVEDVVDPIAAKIKTVTQNIQHVEQANAFDQWINKKVKPLMELLSSSNLDDKSAISNAVMKHVVETNSKQIETDIRIIKCDQEHKLNGLGLDEGEKTIYLSKVEDALSGLIRQWRRLEEPPKNLTLERLRTWKSSVDNKRNDYHHMALEIIDRIIPESMEPEEVHEHLVRNFQQIEELEVEIPSLIEEISQEGLGLDNIFRFNKRLALLVEKARDLELDLRLTPELEERLKVVKKKLKFISKELDKYQS